MERLRAAIAQAQACIVALRSQYRSLLENDRIDALAQINRGKQELNKADLKAGLLELRAPHDGLVKELSVTGLGAVVAAGSTLLGIVPRGKALQAEVLLDNEDVGFVAVGQRARIKFMAYPFQRCGMADGRITLVSADAVDPRQTPAGQAPSLAYRALVDLDADVLSSPTTGERLMLAAGMRVTAEIHQGERSVMEYLLSPVRKVAQEAGRER